VNAVLPHAARALRLPDVRRTPGAGVELLSARTDDGVTLAIERVRPNADRREAVILLHGLSSNGAPFDLEGRSLARHLAAAGFDCFIPDLRGARYSERPRRPWGLDELVEQDLPAIIRTILAETKDDRLSWVGHSMGGLLLFFHGIEHPDIPVRRAVTLGAAIDYRPGASIYRDLRQLLPLANGLRYLPFGHISRLLAPLAGRGPILPTERMNFRRGSVEPEVASAVMREFHHIPVSLFHGLDTTFGEGGFERADGRIRYLERASAYQVPTLFVGGSHDAHCSPEAIENTATLLGGHPRSQAQIFGSTHGHTVDYGHFDLLVGRRAPDDVWPILTDWLSS
jgi:pimeloyl-ACP methyl ester carboxylesterase